MLQVDDDSVWRQTRILFLGSAWLSIINVHFGFDNALTAGEVEVPRRQILIHLLASSVGWIMLSLIGLARRSLNERSREHRDAAPDS